MSCMHACMHVDMNNYNAKRGTGGNLDANLGQVMAGMFPRYTHWHLHQHGCAGAVSDNSETVKATSCYCPPGFGYSTLGSAGPSCAPCIVKDSYSAGGPAAAGGASCTDCPPNTMLLRKIGQCCNAQVMFAHTAATVSALPTFSMTFFLEQICSPSLWIYQQQDSLCIANY